MALDLFARHFGCQHSPETTRTPEVVPLHALEMLNFLRESTEVPQDSAVAELSPTKSKALHC